LDAVAEQFEAREIRLERDVEDFLVDSTVLYPVGIILNELITNSFKYAFPAGRKGRISTRLKREGDAEAILSIRDDGIGLPPGFDPAKSDGFGFVLVSALVAQLGGSLAIVGEGDAANGGGGAGFDIRFPVGGKPA
jgi:two-component sensor histidine kinase